MSLWEIMGKSANGEGPLSLIGWILEQIPVDFTHSLHA